MSDNNELMTVKLTARGRVQGVGYRILCCQVAKECGVTGTVQNKSDGTVEIHVTATRIRINTFKKKCYEGNGWSKVSAIDEKSLPLMKFSDFRVTFQ